MTVLRSTRCGDCLFVILGVLFICSLVYLIYLRGPDNTRYYQKNLSAHRDDNDGANVKKPGDDQVIWPAGKMKQHPQQHQQQQQRKPVKELTKKAKRIQDAIGRLGMEPLPDTRPAECHLKFHEDPTTHGELLKHYAKARIGIVVIPAERTFSLPKFKTTIVSLLATTAFVYPQQQMKQIDVGFVTASQETANQLRESFDVISTERDNKNLKKTTPNFRVLERESFFDKETLFKELLAIAATDFSHSDIVIFLTSGFQCNIGWLESLIHPLLTNTSPQGPVIVAPHYTYHSSQTDDAQDADKNRIIFNWRLAPKFVPVPKKIAESRDGATDAVASFMFLPQAFAIKRSSEQFGRFLSFLSQRNIGDPTVFDAAMYFSRCLGSDVVTAPCSRLTLTNGNVVGTEFDPFLKTPQDTKKRLAATWLNEYRTKLEPILGKWQSSFDGPAHCKELSSVLAAEEERELFMVPEEFKTRGDYFYLASLAGTTFLPTNGEMRAGICPFPESPEMMFKHTLSGTIQSPSGMCVTAPSKSDHGYIKLVECLSADVADTKTQHQQWQFLQGGKLQSVRHRTCLMHATDPHAIRAGEEDDDAEKIVAADPTTQVLMLGDCTTDDSNFYKFTFAKNC